MLIGIFLILFGALMLLDKIGWIDIHMGDYILPILLIALGVSMVARQVQPERKSSASKP
jgi:hypothetical protein